MAAKKGNQYWQFRNKHGRPPRYRPEELWDQFVEYSKWLDENPLREQKVFHSGGEITKTDITRMRAMTERAFCLFADCAQSTFEKYKTEKDYSEVTKAICDSIYAQKFEGASADMLNANIIARDLGLKDQSEVGVNLLTPPAELRIVIEEPKNATD